MAIVLMVFGIVILHELGHALTARRFGIRTPDITLLPIGGMARLERMPDEPKQELLVALAGPAVNVALASVLALVLVVTGQPLAPLDPLEAHLPILTQLLWINVVLAVFNLIPAFPMDGGRVVRAILAMRLPPVRATELAARLGQGMAILLGILGLMVNPLLAIIALFVWTGAGAEARLARMKLTMEGLSVGHVMARDIWVLHPGDPLAVATEYLLHGFQTDFPVVDHGRLVGMLPHAKLMATLAERGAQARVADAMETHCESVRPDDALLDAFERLARTRCSSLPVVDRDVLVGMLSLEAVSELMAIRAAMDAAALRAGLATMHPGGSGSPWRAPPRSSDLPA